MDEPMFDPVKTSYFNGSLSNRTPFNKNETVLLSLDIYPVSDLQNVTMTLSLPPKIESLDGKYQIIGDVNSGEEIHHQYTIKIHQETNYRNIHVTVNGNLDGREISQKFYCQIANFTQNENFVEKSGYGEENYVTPNDSSRNIETAPLGTKYYSISLNWQYLDENNIEQPVRSALVRFYETDEPDGTDDLLSFTYTDAYGNSNIQIDSNDGPNEGGRDVYAIIYSLSGPSVVKNCNGVIYSWSSCYVFHNIQSDISETCVIEIDSEAMWAMDAALEEYNWVKDKVGWNRGQIVIFWPCPIPPPFYEEWPAFYLDNIYLPNRHGSNTDWGRETVYHEYGHAVQYSLYGNQMIPSNYQGDGYIFSETDYGWALREGWPLFMEGAVTNDPKVAVKYSISGDFETNTWYNKIDSGDMDGDIVEGSIASIFWDIHDDGFAYDDNLKGGFSDIFYILYSYKPKSIHEFWYYWFNGNYPSGNKFGDELEQIFEQYGVAVSQPITKYTITASTGPGGIISPSGSIQVTAGSSQTFTITSNSGYQVSTVIVNGVNIGAVTSYTFINVQRSQTISATFTQIPLSYPITASAGAGGNISPAGSIQIAAGSSFIFLFIPNTGYQVSSVTVDGVNQGAIPSYAFTNIQGPHTIYATFSQIPPIQYIITASAGAGGVITPTGFIQVSAGSSQTFTITPNAGYQISSVTVNGGNVGVITSYTFTNVQGPQTIQATFSLIPPLTTIVTTIPTTAPITIITTIPTTIQTTVPTTYASEYTITAIPDQNGIFAPAGLIKVTTGSNQQFTIIPMPGYKIDRVIVDGVNIGAVNMYTFNDVRSDHALNAYFIGENQSLHQINLPLEPGWNLISAPKSLKNGFNNLNSVIGSTDTANHSVYVYNTSQNKWTTLKRTSIITPLDGIWVYSNSKNQANFIINDVNEKTSKSIYIGWNAVGCTDLEQKSAQENFYSIQDLWTMIIGFDAINQKYETSIINGGSGTHSDLSELIPGKGYWIYSNQEGLLQTI